MNDALSRTLLTDYPFLEIHKYREKLYNNMMVLGEGNAEVGNYPS